MKIILYNKEVEIDDNCINLVRYFNKVGLVTEFSCSGHGEEDFIIIFDQKVKDEQMEDFVNRISDQCDHTPLIGCFYKWYRKSSNIMISTWEYKVHSIAFAQEDFNRMKGLVKK